MPHSSSSLYARFFTSQERQDLEQIPSDDLTGEINLQRTLLVLIQSASPECPIDFKVQLEKTRADNLVIRALLASLRVELNRRSLHPESAQLIQQALHIAAGQMGVPDYLTLPERPFGDDQMVVAECGQKKCAESSQKEPGLDQKIEHNKKECI